MSVFLITVFVPMSIAIGLSQLGRPFGVLYALPVAVLMVLGIAYRRDAFRSSRFVLAAALGQWLSLLSWVFSRHAIPSEESTRLWASNTSSVAKAGLPIQAIEIPPSPMGSDVIPIDMWAGVFTNHVFWFIVALFVAGPLLKRITKARGFTVTASAVLGSYALLANLALFAIWYD